MTVTKSLSRFLLGISATFLTVSLSTARLDAQTNFVYTNNDVAGANTVSAFSLGSNGILTQIPGSPFRTGGIGVGGGFIAANRITVVGGRLYASNSSSDDISVFSIDSATGNLVLLAGSPFSTGSGSFSGIPLSATPDGKFLLAGNSDSKSITVFSIASNGSLTRVPGSPFSAGVTPSNLKVSPDGKFLTASGGSVAVFSIAGNGALSPVPGSPFPTARGGFAGGVDINCRSNLLFLGEDTFSASTGTFGPTVVDVLKIAANGSLTQIPASPFRPGVGINSLVTQLSVDDKFLFVSNQGSDSVTAFAVGGDGSLTLVAGSPFVVGFGPSGALPAGMATSSDGKFLYVANFSSVGVFGINTNGALAAVAGSPFGTPGVALSLTAFPPKTCGVTVAIDIKPGEDPASINPKSTGTTPVAILSSPTFDALARVDRTSLTFGRTGDEMSLAFCNSGGEDVNRDGLLDLVCHFNTPQTGFRVGDAEGILMGKTVDGVHIQGKDAVQIVPPH